MLDNANIISQKDPKDALGVAAKEYEQLKYDANILNVATTGWQPNNVVVAGMGGSALAAGLVKDWLPMNVPFEVVRRYSLPTYINENTLVIVSSYSGNTEETLSALLQAQEAGSTVVIIASGGKLIEVATEQNLPYVQLPSEFQPRMAVFVGMRALLKVLEAYGVVNNAYDLLEQEGEWLKQNVAAWLPTTPREQNLAKTLALHAAGKTPVIYGGSKMFAVAYKWKISFNENAKNVAFCNEIPEFNHNEFVGWTSHPIEKPYAVFDLLTALDHPQVQKRFVISDKLLSGKRPHAVGIALEGESQLQQMLWGCVLADFVSIYLALLNGVDPTPVDLIEKFKKELVE